MILAVSKSVAKGAERLVLGVHNENTKALAFYKRQGFDPIDSRRFHVGLSVFCDSVLARTLR
jgi:ribosomal protein S18 acetylase RimI-like enzyme